MKWVLVTGGAKNLGANLCRALAENGYHLLLHYNTSQGLAESVAGECKKFGICVELLQGDFSSVSSVHAFIEQNKEKFSNVFALVNNVGNYQVLSASKTSSECLRDLYQTNLHAPFALIQALLPSLCDRRGTIINIGCAGVETVRADTYSTAYTMTKQSLWLLTKSLALELAPLGVRVNMLSPGHLTHSVDLPEDLSDIPMGRAGTGKELAKLLLFLLDESNAYITGQNVDIAGGVRL